MGAIATYRLVWENTGLATAGIALLARLGLLLSAGRNTRENDDIVS